MKQKTSLKLILFVYAGIMAASTLFVPVKAYIGAAGGPDPDGYTERGYYPIWELGKSASAAGIPTDNTEVKISLNLFAWIMQYLFLTLIFASFYYRTYRYHQEINQHRQAAGDDEKRI